MIERLWNAHSQISKSSLHHTVRLSQLILLTVINFPDLSIKKYVEMSRCRVLVKDVANLQILFDTCKCQCVFLPHDADCFSYSSGTACHLPY